MALPRGARKPWWRARRHFCARRPPYAFRFGPSHDRFELHFFKPVFAIRYLATRSGRRSLRSGLEIHRLHCLRTGGYSSEYFTGLDRWRRAAGDRT